MPCPSPELKFIRYQNSPIPDGHISCQNSLRLLSREIGRYDFQILDFFMPSCLTLTQIVDDKLILGQWLPKEINKKGRAVLTSQSLNVLKKSEKALNHKGSWPFLFKKHLWKPSDRCSDRLISNYQRFPAFAVQRRIYLQHVSDRLAISKPANAWL